MHRLFDMQNSFSTKIRKVFIAVVALLILVIALRAYAAEISAVLITDVKSDSATVTWTTDKNTDATINFGLDEQIGRAHV